MFDLENEILKLNEKQRQVVNEIDKNILLLAAAGTGKTNSLALRIANIIEKKKSNPKEILCLTFTNRACKEMKERIISVVGKDGLSICINTFHSFCFSIIKEESKKNTDVSFDFIIYDEEDCKEIIREFNVQKFNLNSLQNFIDFMKNEKLKFRNKDYIDILKYNLEYKCDELKKICIDENKRFNNELFKFIANYGHKLVGLYDRTLHERHGLDFNDLLLKVYELFEDEHIASKWRKKFKYIHIDEVQDTSIFEYSIISKLFYENNIMICGDYFQTIYEWRGSNPKNVLNKFENQYTPITIIFDKNYRSTKTLLNASYDYLKNAFESEINDIYEFDFKANSDCYGENIEFKTAYDIEEEATWIFNRINDLKIKDVSKVAILTRNNKINIALSNALINVNRLKKDEEKLYFLLVDEFKFFRRQEIKDIIAYLKLITNKYDNNSLKRILKKFSKGIGEKTIEKIENNDFRELGIKLYDFIDYSTQTYGDPYQLLLREIEKNNVVVFDVESTGINTVEDEIVQIAAIKINKFGSVIEKFEKFLIPTKSVGNSELVHGFSNEFLEKNGEDSKSVLKDFLNFIKNTLVVGHNVSYDLSILNSELQRKKLPRAEIIDYYDTLDLARKFYPNLKNHKLETLSNLFNTEVKSSHNAMDDILSTKDILIKFVEENIKPMTLERLSIYNKYSGKFYEVFEYISDLRNKSENLRPQDLISYIVKTCGILDFYNEEQIRISNLREFYMMAKNMDDEDLNCIDSLIEILKVSALSNSEMDRMLKKYPRIPIITVHQAKGAEFDYVFLAGMQDYTFPSYQSIRNDDLEEEKRVFYVAITRAKKQLFLSYCKKSERGTKEKSRLINFIPKKYIDEV